MNLKPAIERGGKRREIPILEVAFAGEVEERPVLSYIPSSWNGPVRLTGDESQMILQHKKELWKRYGWITHSDAAFLTFHVLRHETLGPVIRREICRRYPFVVIDELQDTGCFLGKCILSLLSEPGFRAVLVGDPDQAIYEFNGARPDLFDTFAGLQGAHELPLGESLRCSARVARAAGHLSATNRVFQGTGDGAGRAILIGYRELEGDLARIEGALSTRVAPGGVRIVARSGSTVETVSRQRALDLGQLGSRPLNHLHRATNLFRRGKLPHALAASKAFLGSALLGSDGLTEEEVGTRGVSPQVWKRLAAEVLLDSATYIDGESVGAWGERVERDLKSRLIRSSLQGIVPDPRIRRPKEGFRELPRAQFLAPWPRAENGKLRRGAQTVHAVKGETHDVTVLVAPNPRRVADCPSETWWSNDREHQEERRIAFVAATRSRGDFILLAAQPVLDRLRERRAAFCESFDVMSADEYAARFEAGTAAFSAIVDQAEVGR